MNRLYNERLAFEAHKAPHGRFVPTNTSAWLIVFMGLMGWLALLLLLLDGKLV